HLFSSRRHLSLRYLHSFPTRRSSDLETERYNKADKRASLPQFATMMADDSTLLSGISELDAVPPQSQALTEQRLKYWFKQADPQDRKSTRLNSSHVKISYAVFCLKKK